MEVRSGCDARALAQEESAGRVGSHLVRRFRESHDDQLSHSNLQVTETIIEREFWSATRVANLECAGLSALCYFLRAKMSLSPSPTGRAPVCVKLSTLLRDENKARHFKKIVQSFFPAAIELWAA